MHRNALFFFVLLGGAIAAGLFGGHRSGTAALFDAASAPVVWEGKVFGTMESGQAFALRGTGDSPELFYAWFSSMPAASLDGTVRLSGRNTGMTCAYQNTVFDGRCVPEFLIQEVLP